MTRVAKLIYIVPATSTPMERKFKGGAETVTKKRSRLDPVTVSHLLFLRDIEQANERNLEAKKKEKLKSLKSKKRKIASNTLGQHPYKRKA